MGWLVLVLPALLRSSEHRAFRRSEAGALLDGRCRGGRSPRSVRSVRQPPLSPGRSRSLHRWGRARRAASLVCAVLAQGALRSRARLDSRAVPAARQPGNDPRRGRPQNVEALGQCDRPDRCDRNLRRGCVPLLRDVHGPARTDEAVEHEGRGRRLAVSGARLAFDDEENQAGEWELSAAVQEVEPTRRS